MDLWSGPLTDFVEHASRKTLSAGMSARFRARHGQQPGQSELNSWEASLARLADSFRALRPYGVGVSLNAPLSAEASLPTGPAMALEYHLPISLRRIDVVLTGRDQRQAPNAVILELKQWTRVDLEDEHALNVRVGQEEHVHPSEQALDYAAWLQDYHSAFADEELLAVPAAYQAMDLLLVDEAHRVRETSNTFRTPAADRATRSQTRELMDAAKVSVFLLDENQFMRPDEVGSSKLVEEEASNCGARFRSFDLVSQYRCGGAIEYIQWVDRLLGFSGEPGKPWGDRFRVEVVDSPAQLDQMLEDTRAYNDSHPKEAETAGIVAGFCWPWSDAPKTGPLVRDVVIGDWARAWNRKPNDKAYKPATHPYTLWAETDEGLNQVGCIYSVQGFEFDRVGVVWGPDLVWRSGEWVAQKSASHDKAVARSKDLMLVLVRNAYRVLLTRGMKQVKLLVLDEETRKHIQEQLAAMQG